MENKELMNEVLNSMKEFKIIAYKSDEEIANKILKIVRNGLIDKIDDYISENNFDSEYVDGLTTACDFINKDLS